MPPAWRVRRASLRNSSCACIRLLPSFCMADRSNSTVQLHTCWPGNHAYLQASQRSSGRHTSLCAAIANQSGLVADGVVEAWAIGIRQQRLQTRSCSLFRLTQAEQDCAPHFSYGPPPGFSRDVLSAFTAHLGLCLFRWQHLQSQLEARQPVGAVHGQKAQDCPHVQPDVGCSKEAQRNRRGGSQPFPHPAVAWHRRVEAAEEHRGVLEWPRASPSIGRDYLGEHPDPAGC